ncbi:uncharacterized protein DSM5745_01869 [Aspergillus mulundensis]|uniref:Uncharacterized protein n=1 Tax=Aspergillus mulundensis TaxID=1810919 RepID=A0A3D8SUZ8_9EURO|nr:hypothetical protein DSM5745_01869 [Aspergillus mulundensis]RDW90094.1 hypothetical protein DSM5745_01869 [Aspergillus mulundensis]
MAILLPGWLGARSVKWLARIWITDYENDSYYHLYDNRQLPSLPSIMVRAIDELRTTQPPEPVWSITGRMNDCWYPVRPDINETSSDSEACLLFRHPVDAGNSTDGWMKESAEKKIKEIKRKAGAPGKWHPGGKGPIIEHAGAVHMDTTEEFERIHDDYAQSKLKECIIRKVTQKTMAHMAKNAQQKAQEKSNQGGAEDSVALDKHN